MRCQFEAVGVGQRGDAQAFAEAAGDREVGLQHVDRAPFEQFLEVERGELALAGRDRQVAGGAHLGEALAVVGRDRFFDEAQAEFGGAGAETLGLGDVHRAVRVDHQLDAGADRGAGGAGAGEACVDATVHRADAHLDRAEAGGGIAAELGRQPGDVGPAAAGVGADRVAARAAEQVEHRTTARLGGEVPKGQIDAGQRRGVRAAATEHRHRAAAARGEWGAGAVVHARPGRADPARVLAHQQRAQFVFDDGHQRAAVAGAADRGLGLAVAHQAVIGADRHQHRVERGQPAEIGDVLHTRIEWAMQPGGVDGADVHAGLVAEACRWVSEPAATASSTRSRTGACRTPR